MLPHIKRFLCTLLLVVTTLPAAAGEIDEIDIRANFTNFWSAMSTRDYKGAAAFVHPLDLAALRTQLLPVFVRAGEIPNESVQSFVGMFFQDIPKERRARLSGPEIYVLLFKMLEQADPKTVGAFKLLQPEILDIKLEQPNTADVRIRVKVLVEPETGAEKAAIEEAESKEETRLFGKLNGRWYMRMPRPPSQTAAEFKKQLGF